MDYCIRKLQLLQLEILKDIDKICSKHGLTYYLIGGTLLGAVRHKGFIPWDDDLDIAMYREDYELVQKIIKKDHSEKYFVQNSYTDKNYTRFICKIRLNGTLQIEKGFDGIAMHQGIYIDIFPLDKVNKKGGLWLEIRGWLIRLLLAYKTAHVSTHFDMVKWKKYTKKIVSRFTFLIPQRLINWAIDRLCIADKNKNNPYTTSFLSGYGWKKQLFSNEVFGRGVRLEFEGLYFNSPDKYEVVLKRLYNDYWKLPPEDKRYIGHNLVRVDYGNYNDKLDEIFTKNY